MTGRVDRHRVLVVCRVVDDYDTFLTFKRFNDAFFGARLIELKIDRLRVRVEHGNSYRSCGNFDRLISEYFLGFFHHLFLFLGISVVEEYVDMRQAVVCNLIWEFLSCILLSVDKSLETFEKVVVSRNACAAYRLICAVYDSLDAVLVVERLEGYHCLNGRAVWIGNNTVIPINILRVDFRYYKRYSRVHSPLA